MPSLIAHEWIARHGGSENVLSAMADAYPEAVIRTLWNDTPDRFVDTTVVESWLARTPLRGHKALSLAFMSRTWTRVDTSEFDFVLASSHVFSHHIGGLPRDGRPPKFVYVHTPMRTIYAAEQDSRGRAWAVRAVARAVQRYDRRFVGDQVQYAANSEYIRRRIQTVWGQDARVIHPPVDTSAISTHRLPLSLSDEMLLAAMPSQFVLGASRFVPYKRLDLVIATAEAVAMPVVIAGRGPRSAELHKRARLASVPVHIVEAPSDAALHEMYRRASVFVFPAVEDFGIMPLEAMAAGTPVVVGPTGGAREGVEAAGGGVVADAVNPDALAHGVRQALDLDMMGVPSRVSERFGRDRFISELRDWINDR